MKKTPRLLRAFIVMSAMLLLMQGINGQSVLDPKDSVITYNSSSPAGSLANPTVPPWGTIKKWIRTVRLNWNTNQWKCYVYNSLPFRLIYPKSYNPAANDGKKYPMIIFFHGAGEAGPVTDNEYSLANGGPVFTDAVNNGAFDGYMLVFQTPGNGWSDSYLDFERQVADYMITNNKVDPFRISVNGLSAGGYACWGMKIKYPQYIIADLPMSGVAVGDKDSINLYKYSPTWYFQGGLDQTVDPNTALEVVNAINAKGGNLRYTLYPQLGHGTWTTAWAEPDFWPFINRAYGSNPYCLFGRTAFCPGDPINVTIGVAPKFNAYQWRKNGVMINGASGNSIQATDTGTYDCRVMLGTNWSDWSHTPVVISIKQPTVTPPIQVNGLMSKVIPSLSNAGVSLKVPAGYVSYTWQKVGDTTRIGNDSSIFVTRPGNYIVKVTEQFGCSSSFSSSFTVIDSAGPNKPDPASNLLISTISQTSLELDWSQNPMPVNNETGFEIYQATQSGGPYKLAAITAADVTSQVLAGLNSKTKYYYVIRAVNNTGASAVSKEAVGSTSADTQPPTAPGSLTLTATTRTSASLIWTAATDNIGVTQYYLFINGVKSYSTTQTSFTVNGLTNGQNYTFTVQANDQAGNTSIMSNQVSTQARQIGIPYNYYAFDPAVTWNALPDFGTLTPVSPGVMPNVSVAAAPQATNYAYLWQGFITIPVTGSYTFRTNSDDGSRLWIGVLNQKISPYSFAWTPTVNNDGLHATQNATSSTMSLTAGSYPIAIAYYQQGGGASITVSWNNPQTGGNFVAIPDSAFADKVTGSGVVPVAPTTIKATAVSYKQINLTWGDNSNNETAFEIYRASSSGGSYTIIASVPANVTTYADSSLAASTTYYYKVQAVNQTGASGFDPASMGGISYAYYPGVFNTIPNFGILTPALTGSLSNVSLSPSPSPVNYAFKFQGIIQVPTAGTYNFYTSSDDGSNLYIGSMDSAHLVVMNDGLHGTVEKSGSVTLNAGSYPLYVTFIQQGGGAVLTLSYAGPSLAKMVIPDAAFANPNPAATTLALPAAPVAPYNAAATALSSSVINLGWQDSSAVNGYNIYRSIGDSSRFLLIAALPAGTVSYSDTALYANQLYYYKINASWVGGVTPYSTTLSARAKNVPPVITKLASRTMRYGATLNLSITANSPSGAVNFSQTGLPAFGTLTSTGGNTATLTLTPVIANQGTYNGITIIATDANGGADSAVFSLIVNSNYTPVIAAVRDTTVNEKDSLRIPLTAMDSSVGKTLTWSISNVPANTSLVNTGNGSAILVFKPGYAAAGVYTVNVKINDGEGDSSLSTFKLTVNNKDPNTKIYARVKYATVMGAPWNNMTGITTNNMKDQNGMTTSVGVNFLQSWWMPFNAGPTTGNNSGVYPDGVLSDFWYFGYYGGPETASLAVVGLNPGGKYNLTFYAGSNFVGMGDNGTTIYTIGTQSVSLYVQGNTRNTVSINNLSPDVSGKITVNMKKAANTPIGYLNALVITSVYDDGTLPAGPGALTAANVPGKGVQLNWVDSAYNETGYEIYRATGAGAPGTFSLLTTASPGTVAYLDSAVSGAARYYYMVRAVNTHGASGYSNTVSLVTTDRVPKLNPITDVILKNNMSTTVAVKAVDDSTDHVTLTVAGLPSFASFTDNGNGTGTITIQPASGAMGAFTGIQVTATDNSDSTSQVSFNLYVVDANVASTYIDITNYDNLSPAPWNNMAIPFLPYAGTAATNLKDDGNNATGISVTLTDAWDGVSSTGMRLGNGSNVYPATVERSAVYTTSSSNHRITVTGLSTTRKYNFLFFNSHGVSESTLTNFTIGSQTVSLNGSYNSNKTVQINGVTTANGTIVINCMKDASAVYAMLSAMVIESYTPGAVTTLSPADLRVLDYSMTNKKSNSIMLQWQDRADNETGYEVWRANDGGAYSRLTTLAANSTAYTDSNLAANTAYNYTVRAVNGATYSSYSSVASGYTFSPTVYINFNSAANAVGSPWNNLNWVYGIGSTWKNFLDETGVTTNVGMIQPVKVDGMVSPGVNTGNNSGIFPDKVMAEGFGMFPGDTTAVVLTGLNVSQTYELTVFASLTNYNGDNTTVYMINGQTCLLNSLNNKTGTLTMHGIIPDANGQARLSFTGFPTSTFGLLGAMIVRGYNPSGNVIPAPPISTMTVSSAVTATTALLMMTDSAATGVRVPGELKAYPNPFGQYFMLLVPARNNDRVNVLLSDLGGRIVYQQTFEGLYAGENQLRIQPNATLAPSVYILTLSYNDRVEKKMIKLIKKD